MNSYNRSNTVPIPDNEEERLKNLSEYSIMDTAPEMVFDEITELAAEILQCPVSFIQFMNEDRQWFKSKYGLPEDFVETPRDLSVCATTICQNDLLLIPDLSMDDRFSDNPAVKSEPNIRFYAGMPLITPSGHAVGTICTIDFERREISLDQQEALRRLSHQVVTQLELRRTLVEMDQAIKSRDAMVGELAEEKSRSDELLLNILPEPIAEELKETDRVEPRFYSAASVIFGDFVGFTQLAENLEPKSLIELLHQYFCAFDKIIANHDMEKMKTIGDAYMCASGLPDESRGHAIKACLGALEIQHYLARSNEKREKMRMPLWEMRIGIHSGPVIAGVVGEKKFTYDIWGDAVNIAALMEQQSEPGMVNISETTYQNIKEVFDVKERGKVQSEKKGELPMYYVTALKDEFSNQKSTFRPNDYFFQKFGTHMKTYRT